MSPTQRSEQSHDLYRYIFLKGPKGQQEGERGITQHQDRTEWTQLDEMQQHEHHDRRWWIRCWLSLDLLIQWNQFLLPSSSFGEWMNVFFFSIDRKAEQESEMLLESSPFTFTLDDDDDDDDVIHYGFSWWKVNIMRSLFLNSAPSATYSCNVGRFCNRFYR